MDYEHITAVAFIMAGCLLAAMLFVSLGCVPQEPVNIEACESWMYHFATRLEEIKHQDWRVALHDKQLQALHEARTSEALATWATIEHRCLSPYRKAAQHP